MFFLVLELLVPYRLSSVPKRNRWLNNIGLAVCNSIVLNLLLAAFIMLTAAYHFHHSSLTVPSWFEGYYGLLFVPPSMHRIHHSVVINERNTNYGAIFSLWDRALGTLLTGVDQVRIRIGMGAYRQPEKLNFFHLLIMPFTKEVK